MRVSPSVRLSLEEEFEVFRSQIDFQTVKFMQLDPQTIKSVITNLFLDGWNQQQFASFADSVADPVRFNFRGTMQKTNVEELRGLVTYWKTAFPDLSFQILDIIVENNRAAANLVFTGTHQGVWQNVPATGRSIQVEEMMFFRFEKGKIVEMWEVYDEAMMMKQLQAS